MLKKINLVQTAIINLTALTNNSVNHLKIPIIKEVIKMYLISSMTIKVVINRAQLVLIL